METGCGGHFRRGASEEFGSPEIIGQRFAGMPGGSGTAAWQAAEANGAANGAANQS